MRAISQRTRSRSFAAGSTKPVKAQLPMVNAMTLATVGADGQPAARVVLLKGVDHGFVFYTDYTSRKARELAANARAALLLYWIELEREVRIEGSVEKTSERESDDYFASRPLGSRLAALASSQSEIVADRQALERSYAEVEQRHGAQPPRPAQMGRLPRGPARDRVLARPAQPPARPPALSEKS